MFPGNQWEVWKFECQELNWREAGLWKSLKGLEILEKHCEDWFECLLELECILIRLFASFVFSSSLALISALLLSLRFSNMHVRATAALRLPPTPPRLPRRPSPPHFSLLLLSFPQFPASPIEPSHQPRNGAGRAAGMWLPVRAKNTKQGRQNPDAPPPGSQNHVLIGRAL